MKKKEPSSFEVGKPRTHRAEVRSRERQLQRTLEDLLASDDEATFLAGLKEDFGVDESHPKFATMLAIFRARR